MQEFQVEKDYFVSLLLKTIQETQKNVEVVFKGGTSLSKCYDIIDRFSEDIDLAIIFSGEKPNNSMRKRLKNTIIEAISRSGMILLNSDELKSNRDYNYYEVAYDQGFEANNIMIPHVVVETIVAYKPYPIIRKNTSNYITKFLSLSNRFDLIETYELKPFEITLQGVGRTFIDKLFAICDYHIDKKYNRNSRHIYDIHMIWSKGILDLEETKNMIENIVKDRQIYGVNNKSCLPGAQPLTLLREIIVLSPYKSDYNNVTMNFLYKKVEYDVCIKSIEEIILEGFIPDVIGNYQ